MDRLVVGGESIDVSLVERLTGRRGSLLVLLENERQVETLREEGIDTRHVDVTDAAAIRTVAGSADSVVVAPTEPTRAAGIASAVREAYPDAFVLGCLCGYVSAEDRRAVETHVDRVVDVTTEASTHLLERAGDRGIRTRKLQGVLRDVDGTLAVFAHDNPDPDAIASAVGLCRLAEATGTDAQACYYGEISHQENRALVNLLEYDLVHLEANADLSRFDAFALVDHSRPGVNDGLPTDTPIDVVIDHHPPRAPVEARFVDLRSDVGATSTLVTGYFDQLGVVPDADLASGLLYGIRTDTQEFSRAVSVADFTAASQLVALADSDAIQRIESPSVSTETLEILGRAITNRRVENGVLTSSAGRIADRDALAQAADRLLGLEDVTTTVIFGFTDEMVYVSARSRGTDLDLGEVLRDAFEQIGSAGGHANMAGAQLPVGFLFEETDETDREQVVEDVVTERFFEAIGVELDSAAAVVYADFLGTDDLDR